jgi:hypothetical protein
MARLRTDADRAYDKKYKEHPEVYARMRMKRRANLKAYLKTLKEKPCADCGNTFPFYVMDFDHREGVETLFMISRYAAKR